MNTSIGRYTLGLGCALVIGAALGLGAVALRRRFFGEFAGAIARLTELVIASALLITVLEILGAAGLFRLGPIVVGCALAGVGAVWVGGGGHDEPPAMFLPSRLSTRDGAAAAAVLVSAVLGAEYASPTLQAYDRGVHVLDSIWYHLPLAASFAQSGHVTLPRYDVEFLTAFYPATGELLHGLGILLLARDTLSPAFNLLLLGPTMLAGWCIGRARGGAAAAVCGVAVVLATPMMLYSQAGSADNDILGVFFLLAAVALLLSAPEQPAVLALAGIAAGIAISVRLTLIAPVAALTVGVLVSSRHRRLLPVAAQWCLPLALAGGYWFVRNLAVVGNPVPWLSLGLLPTPAPPLQAHVDYAVAHYVGDGRVWSRFWQPALASGLGGWWYVIVAGAVLGPLGCLVGRSERQLRMLAVVTLTSLAAYLVTPEGAMGPPGDPVGIAYNLRYAAPGLALGFALLALAPPLTGVRRQRGLVLALLAVLTATVAEPRLWPAHHLAGAIPVGCAVLIAGVAVIWAARRSARRRTMLFARGASVRAVAFGAVLAVLIAGAAGGYLWQRHYLRERYAFRPGVSQLARLWAFFRSVHHADVGVAGTYVGYFSYPLFGLDDSNRVVYIGRHGPHGSFTPIRSCRQWRRAVAAGRFRYVVTTPARDLFRPRLLNRSPEFGWTVSDPHARLVFRDLAQGQPIAVFELHGSLQPTGCR